MCTDLALEADVGHETLVRWMTVLWGCAFEDFVSSELTRSLLPVTPAHRLAERAAEQRWLVSSLWSEEAVGIIGGEPKCCKFFLALDLAVSVAAGTPCLRRFAFATISDMSSSALWTRLRPWKRSANAGDVFKGGWREALGSVRHCAATGLEQGKNNHLGGPIRLRGVSRG